MLLGAQQERGVHSGGRGRKELQRETWPTTKRTEVKETRVTRLSGTGSDGLKECGKRLQSSTTSQDGKELRMWAILTHPAPQLEARKINSHPPQRLQHRTEQGASPALTGRWRILLPVRNCGCWKLRVCSICQMLGLVVQVKKKQLIGAFPALRMLELSHGDRVAHGNLALPRCSWWLIQCAGGWQRHRNGHSFPSPLQNGKTPLLFSPCFRLERELHSEQISVSHRGKAYWMSGLFNYLLQIIASFL